MQVQGLVDGAVKEVGNILLGKEPQIRLALCCLFARGHLLLEDLPGMGKTTLSHALASVLGLSWKRVQFTSDLLPADILGVSVFDSNDASFTFHPGPIFTQLLLADEINRTTPRTQSALLEAMAEGQVTVEGETRPLPQPFFVIATQNPVHQSGTYPLPESQLDRFLMRLELGYPHPQAERQMFERRHSGAMEISNPRQCIDMEQLEMIRIAVSKVHASENLLDYLQRLVAHTRQSPEFEVGLSPRGALALLDCAKTWAAMHNRGHVVPEDLQAVLPAVAAHRLVPSGDYAGDGDALVDLLRREVDVIGR
ncbi:MAG: AAA family ATPase [Halioglobus sp.]|jgi:MoxR-like ATPase|nr:AAA family ATPase [Halioglobus sp.]